MSSRNPTRTSSDQKGGAKRKAGKLSGSLISLSASAIVAVYAIGYVNTHSSVDQIAVVAPPPDQPQVIPTPAPSVARSVIPAPASPTPRPSSSAALAGFKDGTYAGSGSSRHGGMQVKVVIANGKVISAAVTSCGTRYPCSDIDPLLAEVTSGQGAPVDHVSGATDSSNAFKQAVKSALAQATLA